MVQQAKEELVRIDFDEKKQKKINKQVKREKTLAKIEEFLNKLNKECKPVKKDLLKLFKIAELNAKYLEYAVLIQNIKYQQIYRNNGIY